MIETIYREHKIIYDENNEVWQTEVAERQRRSQNLKNCKEAIDKFLGGEEKVKKVFNKIEILLSNYDGYREATITSIPNEKEAWVTDAKGNRSKESSYKLIEKSEHNLAIIKTIKEKQSDVKRINTEIGELQGKLISLNLSKIYQQTKQ